MARKTRVLSIIACGAGPAATIGTLIKQALGRGWTVQVIATPSALEFFDAGEIEAATGGPVRSQYSKPGAPRSRSPSRGPACAAGSGSAGATTPVAASASRLGRSSGGT